MIKLETVPETEEAWFEIYGDPRSKGDNASTDWIKDNLDWFALPFNLFLSWNHEQEIEWGYMHRRIGPVVVDALKEMLDNQGIVYIRENGHDKWGGCFNYRPQRGDSTKMSTHCFGAAIDINPHLGGFRQVSKQPKYITEAFVKRGFTYGGGWFVPDGMHFQAGLGL